MRLAEPRVKKVESHAVAFLGTCDGDEPLVGVVLGLVDLDHAATELANLVDLGTAFADDGTNHVVGDEDLLGHRTTRHGTSTRHGLAVGSTRTRGGGMGRSVRRHLRSGSIAAGRLRGVVHGHRLVGLSRVRLVLLRVRSRRHMMGARIVTPTILLAVAI